MQHLEELLSEAAQKKELNPRRRAFLVAEAVYYNTGEMCPLKDVVKLARQFKLRIILDESLSIGVCNFKLLSSRHKLKPLFIVHKTDKHVWQE